MISKQEIIRSLILSPLYFSMNLDERRRVVETLIGLNPGSGPAAAENREQMIEVDNAVCLVAPGSV